MKLKDIITIISSFCTLIIIDYSTNEELKVFPACDLRIGSPFEDSDYRKAVERDRNIIDEFGDCDVMHITAGDHKLFIDVIKGVM